MYDNPRVRKWGSTNLFCILTDDGYFLRSNGKFYDETFEDSRWKTEQEAEQFLEDWKMNDKIQQCKTDIKKLQEELKKLEEKENRYYVGERFTGGICQSHEYILTELERNKWALIDIESGEAKNGIYNLASQHDNQGRYTIKLPTLFPNETHRKG